MKIYSISGEEGKVVDIKDDKVIVRLPYSKNCEKCNLCKKVSDSLMEVEAYTRRGIEPGNVVKLFIPPRVIVVSAFMLYIFPLIFFIAGYYLGKYINASVFSGSKGELFPALFAFLFLFSSFVIVHFFDRAKRKDKNFKVFAVPRD